MAGRQERIRAPDHLVTSERREGFTLVNALAASYSDSAALVGSFGLA